MQLIAYALGTLGELQPPMGVIPTPSQRRNELNAASRRNKQRLQAKFGCGSHESLLHVIVGSTYTHATYANDSICDHSIKQCHSNAGNDCMPMR